MQTIPIIVTEEGIMIWDNDEHLEKADVPIDFKDNGIEICINDEHL